MAEKTTGIRRILSFPLVYDLQIMLLGGRTARRDLIENDLGLGDRDRVLDVGCGTAKILDYLPTTVDYVGLDISRKYIDAAREKYGHRGSFVCGSVEDMASSAQEGFDLVLGLGLLHHLDDDVVEGLFRAAKEVLKPEGRIFTVDPCFERDQHPVARFLARRDRGQDVRFAEGYTGLASRVFPHVEHRLRRDRLRVPYTHIIMECRR